MIRSLACLALVCAVPTAAMAADDLSFRQIESAQPRDPLTGNLVAFVDVHHSPADQLEPALASLQAAIPAGTPRADAERILQRAGAKCAAATRDAQTCRYSGIETVDEYLDQIKWHVHLALADDRVTGLSVDRDWRRQ